MGMQQDILINWSPQETRVAVIEHGALQELHMERTLERGLVGNVYLGKVSRVLPGMQSAFIDVGLERAAFLHVGDLLSTITARHADSDTPSGQAPLPIEKQVFEGQTLMVQVIKDPIGSKGARLSTQISLAGRMLVFLPQDNHIGISQKIPYEQREALRTKLQGLAHENATAGTPGGFIVRTNAEDASDGELSEDIQYLRKTWSRIKEASTTQPAKTLLHRDLNLLQRVLRDLVGEGTQSIRIDSKEQYEALLTFGSEFMPSGAAKLQLYNQTEALTTIDVNTGGYVGARNFDETIFKTNLEAAGAIARQLRLRNLGGIVVADFIDMLTQDHQQAVLFEFRKHLQRDRVKTMVSGFSQLGLVEMTRKRTRESLAHLLCEPCPACDGKGSVKTARTVAYDILREILREARQFNPVEFRVVASTPVIDLLLDDESSHLAGLSDFIGKPISLQSEPSMGPEQYDIVLL